MDVRYWSTFSSLIFHEGCHRLEVSGCHRTTLVLLRGIFCCCCFSYTVVFILLTSIRSDSIVFFFRPVVQICIWVILIKWSTLAMRNKRKEARSLMTSGSHTHTHTCPTCSWPDTPFFLPKRCPKAGERIFKRICITHHQPQPWLPVAVLSDQKEIKS